MKLDENIFLLNGAGFDCNVYYLGNGILIDIGSGTFLEEMLRQMEEYEIEPNSIKKVILTHSHYDHVGGCKKFKEKTNTKFFIHEKDKDAVENGEVLEEVFGGEYDPIKVDGTLEEEDVISTDEYGFKVLHTPGHTPGSICLWDKNKNILISGDTLFIDGFGSTDHKGGNKEKLMKSLKKIKKLNEIEVLLPGHGSPASRRNIYARNAIQKILKEVK